MLSPETIQALDEALSAVVEEAGDDPQYAGLVESLTAAQAEVSGLKDGDAEPVDAGGSDVDGAARGAEDDDYSFETAEKRMTARRKPKADAEDKA